MMALVVVMVEGVETVPSRFDTFGTPDEEGPRLMVPLSLLMQDAPEDPSLPLAALTPAKRAGRRFRTASRSGGEYREEVEWGRRCDKRGWGRLWESARGRMDGRAVGNRNRLGRLHN
ncbi:hypothetical protein O3P69_009838 [Scylla paramamosain]|uniref:Uncharacterized protein n=1 Tax=Scylla paramamosain TaxID=85552 RepID=A0AAW0SP06_SCYPA